MNQQDPEVSRMQAVASVVADRSVPAGPPPEEPSPAEWAMHGWAARDFSQREHSWLERVQLFEFEPKRIGSDPVVIWGQVRGGFREVPRHWFPTVAPGQCVRATLRVSPPPEEPSPEAIEAGKAALRIVWDREGIAVTPIVEAVLRAAYRVDGLRVSPPQPPPPASPTDAATFECAVCRGSGRLRNPRPGEMIDI